MISNNKLQITNKCFCYKIVCIKKNLYICSTLKPSHICILDTVTRDFRAKMNGWSSRGKQHSYNRHELMVKKIESVIARVQHAAGHVYTAVYASSYVLLSNAHTYIGTLCVFADHKNVFYPSFLYDKYNVFLNRRLTIDQLKYEYLYDGYFIDRFFITFCIFFSCKYVNVQIK